MSEMRHDWWMFVRSCFRWSRLAVLSVVVFVAQNRQPLLAQSQGPVRVAAAADLQPLLPSLLANYERETGQHVEVSFASSAILATQIENGAPFDAFLSADMALPERIVRDGFAAAGQTAQPYARGTLVLWTRSQSGVQIIRDPQHCHRESPACTLWARGDAGSHQSGARDRG